jgi:hypothetical protein
MPASQNAAGVDCMSSKYETQRSKHEGRLAMNQDFNPEARRNARIAIAMVALWSIMIVTLDAILVRELIEQRSATGYAKTSGMITHSLLVKEAEEDTGPYYIADIEYRFRVGKTEYSGNRYRYGPDSEGSKSAQQLVAEFPVGKKIDVYYNKEDPNDAVLSVGFERTDWYPVIMLIAANAATLALWCWAIWRTRHVSGESHEDDPSSSSANLGAGAS